MRISSKVVFNIFYVSIVFLITHFNMSAQKIETSEIDALFSALNATTPGASVMVTKNGKVVYENGYGSANLEYNIPVTKSTVFHVASLSKQFTIFAILLLEKEGKLSLDDDVRKHLPGLPDFGNTITLRNLANHTSGLRDQWDLLKMSGVRLDDVITQDHVLKQIENQKELNFAPGERNLYCNTGFTLLAEVVEALSGKRFSDFTREHIFEPLGMKNTQFYDDHEKIVPNRAYSYKEQNGQFAKSTLSYATVGPTSLFTTAQDFSAWAMNFNNPIVGDISIIEKMSAATILNNGNETEFASGQFIGNYNSLFNFYHSGSDAGYRSYFMRIPGDELSIAVFSNLSTFNAGSISLKIVDIVLKDKKLKVNNPSQGEVVAHNPSMFKKIPVKELAKYAGSYWSNEFSYKRNLSMKNDTLIYTIGEGNTRKLLPTGTNTFKMVGSTSDIDVIFSKNKDNERTMTLKFSAGTIINFVAVSKVNIQDYVGSYFSEELQTFYRLKIENDVLIVKHHRNDDIKLDPVHKNTFMSNAYFLNKLEFVTNDGGEIIGFKASNGRVKNLWFEKK